MKSAVLAVVLATFGSNVGCAHEAHPVVLAAAAPPVERVEAAPSPREAPIASQPVPGEVRGVPMAFVGASGDEGAKAVSELLRATLVRDGFWIVDAAEGSRDGRIEVKIERRANPSLEGDATAALQVSLTLSSDQETIESLITRIEDADATQKRLDALADRLSSSPRLESFAKIALSHRASRQSAPRLASTGPSPIAPSDGTTLGDESLWSESALRRCRNGRHADDCAKLRSYLDTNPNGAHAANARAALELSSHRGAPLAATAPDAE